jgi:2-keto-4-pentenoate hydratase/2-oxohepta-3-ene-1,7-dioic acid hydratase in catechol pathway
MESALPSVLLEPGDIVATGAPEPDTPLRVGDTIETKIERLGTLRNPAIGEGS